jgi:hypothetical protein
MRAAAVVVLVLTAGCVGDRALPIVSTTSIPGTRIEVDLDGPDSRGDFWCIVRTSVESRIARSLGPLAPDQQTPANLEVIGDGVCRIQWGDGSSAPYVVIDVGNSVIVEDSNPANRRNVRLPTQ